MTEKPTVWKVNFDQVSFLAALYFLEKKRDPTDCTNALTVFPLHCLSPPHPLTQAMRYISPGGRNDHSPHIYFLIFIRIFLSWFTSSEILCA